MLNMPRFRLLLVPIQPLADEIGAGGAAEVAFQFAALELLQMGGLGEEEKLVDGGDVDFFYAAEVYAHAEVGEQEESFFAGHQSGGSKNAQGSADFIVQGGGAVVEEGFSGVVFV